PPPTRPSENPTRPPETSPNTSAAMSVGMFPRLAVVWTVPSYRHPYSSPGRAVKVRIWNRRSDLARDRGPRSPSPLKRGGSGRARGRQEPRGSGPSRARFQGERDRRGRDRCSALGWSLPRHVHHLDAAVLGGKGIARVLEPRLAVADGAQVGCAEPEIVDEIDLDRLRTALG